MVGNEENELQDLRNLRRPCFSRAEAPIGVYNGEQAIIVYDLRPVPHWPKYWIQALAKHFQRQLKPSPKIDISLLDDRIRFSVFVSTDVSAKDLCKLDVNRPGMSGDSSSWKGWGHVRWFIEEVPAGAA